MNNFELEIISPSYHATLIIEWFEVETPTGSFFVGPNHSPLISLVKNKSRIIYKKAGNGEEVLEVPGGFLKIEHNKGLLILDS